jgi:hypothetical protein
MEKEDLHHLQKNEGTAGGPAGKARNNVSVCSRVQELLEGLQGEGQT